MSPSTKPDEPCDVKRTQNNYFRKAVALKPASGLNNIALGKNLVEQGPKEGLQYLSAALKGSKNSSEVHNIVRAILKNAGQKENKKLPIHMA